MLFSKKLGKSWTKLRHQTFISVGFPSLQHFVMNTWGLKKLEFYREKGVSREINLRMKYAWNEVGSELRINSKNKDHTGASRLLMQILPKFLILKLLLIVKILLLLITRLLKPKWVLKLLSLLKVTILTLIILLNKIFLLVTSNSIYYNILL